MPGRAWTDRQRRESITADLASLRERKVATLHRIENDLHEEIRGLELQHAARADAVNAKDEIENLDRLINEQLDALGDLPAPRKGD